MEKKNNEISNGVKKDLPKAYTPEEYEDKIYEKWEKSGYFNPDICVRQGICKKDAKPFSIVLPPPNITDKLHLGHGSTLAIEDLLIRYHRMKGDRTLWLPGTDHAAIATQNVVERRLLEEEKLTRHDLGKEKFLKKVWDFVRITQATILKQTRKMGASLDWSRQAFTLDEPRKKAVRKMFVDMYKEGIIYRGERIVNWCPRCHSTLADDEVSYKEQKAKLYTFKYSRDFPFAIATTRPETKLGDTAVAVNPRDKRYKKYIGKEFKIDFVGVPLKLKIIADRNVDMKFGTGTVGVTPAHSMVDWQMAETNKLPIVKVINEDGKINNNFGKYSGKGVLAAREMIVEELKKQKLLEKEEEIDNNLSICYRCGTPIEPLPSKQWFIAVDKKLKRLGNKSLKEKAIEVAKTGKIEFIPEGFTKKYLDWMENLHDWCISRQIWFGHQIPVWYCGGSEKFAQLKMGFHKDVAPQIFDGKTKTYRLRDHGFKIGDKVLFENSQTKTLFGYGIITEVEETTVEKINYKDSTHYIIYKSLKELIKALKLRNPEKTVTPKSKAYLYAYKFYPFTEKDAKDGCGQIMVSTETPKKCPACGGNNIEQDEDTLDTWFSSGIWTFSTLGWPDNFKNKKKSGDLANYHPTQVLETGYEILTLWVSRMIMMSLFALEEIPFEKVYLHGMILDKHGKKMSKSRGNGIDPIDVINKYGTDAVRLSLLIGNTPGNDTRVFEEKIAGYRNFTNKLWNISRYIITNCESPITNFKIDQKNLTAADEWILGKLALLVKNVTKDLENYQFSQAGERLRDFTWDKFADWYLEIAKIEGDKSDILIYVLKNLLILWHPFMPFVTEAIWKEMGNNNLLMVEPWPKAELSRAVDAKEMSLIKDIITSIRNARAENKVEPGKKVKALIYAGHLKDLVESQAELIKGLRTGIGELEIKEKGPEIKKEIHITIDSSIVEIYLIGAIDKEKEKARIKKEIANLEKMISATEKKLKNKEFITKAPKEIVKKEEEKLKSWREALKKLKG